MNWICSQIGAREHYAIPRVLHREGQLDTLYTDFWSRPWWRKLGNLTDNPNLTARFHPDLAEAKVKSFDLTTLVDSIMGDPRKTNPYDWFLYVGRDFGRSVVESLKHKKNVNWADTIFFGYDTGFLEAATWIKGRGGKTIVCQMDPSRIEVDMIEMEKSRWLGWSKNPVKIPEAFFHRREHEWAVADLVMVNSDWTKQALVHQGVPEPKIVIVPLAYELSQAARKSIKKNKDDQLNNQQSKINHEKTIRVLFLGQVILRKGIQYLIEAAKILKNESVHFDVVGPIGISDEAVKSAPSNMDFHGAITRNSAPDFFCKANVFVLPTLSDGFAITQIEAMAFGLPVITTPNCGNVVTDGMDGVIITSRNAIQLAEAIRSLIKDPEKLESMSILARKKVQQFNLSKLAENLRTLDRRLTYLK